MSSDSTGVEPPTPQPLFESPPSANKPSLFQKLGLKPKQAPPIAFNNQRHKRSSSFSEWASRILPSHKEEKGHTARTHYDPNSSPNAVDLIFGVPASTMPQDDAGTADIGSPGTSNPLKVWEEANESQFRRPGVGVLGGLLAETIRILHLPVFNWVGVEVGIGWLP
jgi:hypothetical protein